MDAITRVNVCEQMLIDETTTPHADADSIYQLFQPQTASNLTATSTGQVPAMRSIDRVFGTYELVEHVLSYLEIEDLVRAQGVSRMFESTTMRSKVLRQVLFLEPRTDLDWTHWLVALSKRPEDNLKFCSFQISGSVSLLDDQAIEHGKHCAKEFMRKHDFGHLEHASTTVLNPLLFAALPVMADDDPANGLCWFPNQECVRTLVAQKLKPAGKFGKMLLTQPPVCEVGIAVKGYYSDHAEQKHFKIKNDLGVTVDDVVEELAKHGQKRVKPEIWFRWDVWPVFQPEKDHWDAFGKVRDEGAR